jgi:hypothetical protein
MYLVKSKVKTRAADFPGNPVDWTVGQVRLVHDSLYLFFRNNPASWEILAGPDADAITAATMGLTASRASLAEGLLLPASKEAITSSLRLAEASPVNAEAAVLTITAATLAAMNNDEEISFAGQTFTKKGSTDAEAGEFADATGLAACINELLDGVWTATVDTDVTVTADVKGAAGNAVLATIAITEATTADGAEAVAATATIDAGTLAVLAAGDTVTFDGNTFTKVAEDAGAGEFTNAAGLITLLDALDDWGAADSSGDIVITAAANGAEFNDVAVLVGLTRTPAGGVDGTVAEKGEARFDEEYFYIATADNLISGANWTKNRHNPYRPDNLWFGIAYNRETAAWVRLGAAAGHPVGQMLPVSVSPLLSNLRRVVLTDAGEVYKGISWLDFTKHDDDSDVALTGTNGQIMVEYKAAYIKTGTVGKWTYLLVSHLPLAGFALHPAFLSADDIVYRGAYEASVYDGKLCSIAKSPVDGTSDVFPVTTRSGDWGHADLTTAATDALAAARNAGGVTGWRQSGLMDSMWERMLFLVAFASYNGQGVVGDGRVSISGGSWTNGSNIGKCGLGDTPSGYHSASEAANDPATSYCQVLGIENPWGNVWERVASLNNNGDVHYKDDPPYNYTATTDWTRLLDAAGQGITLPTSNGYAGTPHTGLGLSLPADVTGSSSSGMFDYYQYASGLRVPLVGGHATNGAQAGPFYVYAVYAATVTHANVGGRLAYVKRA